MKNVLFVAATLLSAQASLADTVIASREVILPVNLARVKLSSAGYSMPTVKVPAAA